MPCTLYPLWDYICANRRPIWFHANTFSSRARKNKNRTVLRVDALLRSVLRFQVRVRPPRLPRRTGAPSPSNTRRETAGTAAHPGPHPLSPPSSSSAAAAARHHGGGGPWLLWAFYAKFAERHLKDVRLALYAVDRAIAASSSSSSCSATFSKGAGKRWNSNSNSNHRSSSSSSSREWRRGLKRGGGAGGGAALALIARAQLCHRWQICHRRWPEVGVAPDGVRVGRGTGNTLEDVFVDITKR